MSDASPILCFSHLRWNFVYQRPQHLLSRLAKTRTVAFLEEPEVADVATPGLRERMQDGVHIATPLIPAGTDSLTLFEAQKHAADTLAGRPGFENALLWYYTPMALPFTQHLPGRRVYDCMDELSMFKNAPPALTSNERTLLQEADVVFTGGRSLYYAKRRLHGNVHCFPSAVDAAHFASRGRSVPDDMQTLKRPRIGFYGVIDERFDTEYVRELAALLDDFEFVFIGPVVKISESELPKAANIHYLGMKSYGELPAYLEHWDIALQPFALNDSTRYISPTKTLEFLAAGKPVISTPIADVVDPYGKDNIVAIAPTPQDAARIAREMISASPDPRWHAAIADIVTAASWDGTVERMSSLLEAPVQQAAAAQ